MLGYKLAKAQPPKPASEKTRIFRSGKSNSFHNEICPKEEIAGLLQAWRNGDDQALERLMPLMYDELLRLARHYMQHERPDHILEANALINEAYIKLLDSKNINYRNKAHFIAISAILMRRVLIDIARSGRYQKRGPNYRRVVLTDCLPVSVDRNVVALDDALSALAELDSQKAKIVELKFFGGLTVKEIAKEVQISSDRVKREWMLAKNWLFSAMSGEESHGSRIDSLD